MVFKKKLLEPEHPKGLSARELARELKVELQVVLEALAAIGEYVASPDKKSIVEPAVRRVCEYLEVPFERDPVRRVAQWETRDVGKRAESRVHRPRRDSVESEPISGRFASLGLGDPRLDSRAPWDEQEWKLYDFTAAERDVWLAHGLRRGQAKDAAKLRDAGLLPPDLGINVYGWTVAKRLRSGEAMNGVKRLLDQLRSEDEVG